jgi:hypothetical protein
VIDSGTFSSPGFAKSIAVTVPSSTEAFVSINQLHIRLSGAAGYIPFGFEMYKVCPCR